MNNTDLLWKDFCEHFAYEKDEYLRIADFCIKNCGEMNDLVLKTAEETAEHIFLFRLPWDMESTSEAVHFGGKIKWDYLHNEDEEFIFQLNRHRYWICLGLMTDMSENL